MESFNNKKLNRNLVKDVMSMREVFSSAGVTVGPSGATNRFKSKKHNAPKGSSQVVIILLLLVVKNFIQFWIGLKKSVIKVIFLGRGVYFKYISHFMLAFILVVGSFIYLNIDTEFSNFVSKYSGISASNASMLVNPGMQSFIAHKQFRITQYIVQPGDTLSSIAAKYSSEDRVITVDTIMWANNLTSNSTLKPGMKLDIPPVSGVLHTVKKGDTLESIAKEYLLLDDNSPPEKVTGVMQSIVDINYLNVRIEQKDGKEVKVPEIFEGQRLIIPDGIKKQMPNQPIPRNQNNAPLNVPPVPIYVDMGPPGTWGWPVANGLGYVSQGWRPGHRAVDVAHPEQPDLVAMDDGVIKYFTYYDGFYDSKCGISIVIAHDTGYETLYCHLTYVQPGLSPGMRVSKGQVVGKMGCTGLCTGPHVHLEIRRTSDKTRINPCSLDLFRNKGDCIGRG